MNDDVEGEQTKNDVVERELNVLNNNQNENFYDLMIIILLQVQRMKKCSKMHHWILI